MNPNPQISGMFVTCFTEKRDDLSQWRSYSGGEGGYAIQFDPIKLLACGLPSVKSQFKPLVKVAYKLEKESVDALLKFGEQCVVELQGFTSYWFDQIAYLAPCFKHPKFEEEREWRFLYSLSPEDVNEKRMRFRQRQYMMTRHIPLLLKPPLPITSVIVGPCRHPEHSVIAVGDLLKTHGYDPMMVSRTEVPYRATSV
jgi:hypothetical protein